MRILCIDYGLCNFHNLISLVEDGHKVYIMSDREADGFPIDYYETFGIEPVFIYRDSELRKFISDHSIDTMIVTNPSMSSFYNEWNDKLKYIGLNPRSSILETHKWFVRGEVEKLGILVPKLLDRPSVPCVMKPYITGKNHDHARICFSEDFDGEEKHFIEEYLTDTIETNVDYVMSHGKWSILHTQQKIGEDLAKMSELIHWTCTSSFKPLSEENTQLTLENAEKFLGWASEFGGSYIGQLTGFIKDGKWYFCENNVRPSHTNSVPYFVTGDEWLMAMSGHPEIIGESFPSNINKMIVKPMEPNSPYPYHLHAKHNVAIPCGLDIIDGEYRVSHLMRVKSKDHRVGIVICDRKIPQSFIDDIRFDGNFYVTSIL